jgi:acetoin utilization protein AcuB
VAIEVRDRTGVMADVTGIVSDMGGNIVSMSTFFRDDNRMMVFRISGDDVERVKKALEDQGYALIGPDHFAHEWS